MANALLLPTTYEDKLDIPGSILKGQQIRANMDNNAMAPYRQKAAENQNAMSDLQLQQAQQGDSLKSIQTKAERLKLQREGSLALLGPAKHIIDVYSKDPELANKLYQPLVKTANEYGVGASPTLNIDEMKSFVAGVEGGNMAGGNLSADAKLARQALIARGNANPNASDIQNEIIRVDNLKNQHKFDSLGGSRASDFYDTTSGRKVHIRQSVYEQDPDRYISGSDADVKSLETNRKTYNATGQLVNTLDRYTDQVTNLMQQYGINKDSRLWNLPVNKLADVAGSGAYAAVKNLIGGIGADLGKIETGSLGNAGASVEALKSFKIDSNMSVGDYLTLFDQTKLSGRNRMGGILQQGQSIHQGLGFKGDINAIYPDANKYLNANDSNKATSTGSPVNAPMTATNPKTGQKIKSIDGGKTWIQASADNTQLAQVTAEDVPIGSGMASQAKSLIQLRRELNDAYLKGDDQRAQDLERQIQQMNSQRKNVG